MGGDSYYIDIIFFAVVAVALVMRLRSVLGKRTGNERSPEQRQETADNVVDLSSARARPAPPVEDEDLPPGPLADGVADIRAADPSFRLEPFLVGARTAFEMIVQAYAANDLRTLRPLLADEVYRPFAAAIEARHANGEILISELMGIREIKAVDARLNGTCADVTVRFVSEQVNALKDAQDRLVDGDPNRLIEVVDLWTFRRDTRSTDPNWQLVATRAAEDLRV